MPNAILVPVEGLDNALIDVTDSDRCQVREPHDDSNQKLVEYLDEISKQTKYYFWHRNKQYAAYLFKNGAVKYHHDRLVRITLQAAIEWCSQNEIELPPYLNPVEKSDVATALTPARQLVLDELDMNILGELAKYNHAVKLVELAMGVDRDRDTCSKRLKQKLIPNGLVVRQTERGGVEITSAGRARHSKN